jgi:hypothetical protein
MEPTWAGYASEDLVVDTKDDSESSEESEEDSGGFWKEAACLN